jgi:hypothetical protein
VARHAQGAQVVAPAHGVRAVVPAPAPVGTKIRLYYDRVNGWGNRSTRHKIVVSTAGFIIFLIIGMVMINVMGELGYYGG